MYQIFGSLNLHLTNLLIRFALLFDDRGHVSLQADGIIF